MPYVEDGIQLLERSSGGTGESFLPQVSDTLRQQLQEIRGIESVQAYECFWSGCNTWDKAKVRYAKDASVEVKETIKIKMIELGWEFVEDVVGILIFSRG